MIMMNNNRIHLQNCDKVLVFFFVCFCLFLSVAQATFHSTMDAKVIHVNCKSQIANRKSKKCKKCKKCKKWKKFFFKKRDKRCSEKATQGNWATMPDPTTTTTTTTTTTKILLENSEKQYLSSIFSSISLAY